MLTNKEIRMLTMTEAGPETHILVSQDIPVLALEFKSHGDYNIIDVYNGNEGTTQLLYRYIIKDFESRLYDVSKNTISDGYLINKIRNNFGWKPIVTASEMEKKKIKDAFSEYFKSSSDCSAFNCIEQYDYLKSEKRAYAKRLKKEKEIDDIMSSVKKIPKDFDKTVDRAMKEHTFLFFNRKKKEVICSNCKNNFSIKEFNKFKEKDKGVCPECKRKATFLSWTRKPKLSRTGMVVLLQHLTDKVLIARYFNIHQTYYDETKTSYNEVVRTVIDYNKNTITDYEWYFYNGKKRWCLPQPSMFNPEGLHYKFLDGAMHENGLTRELKKAGVYEMVKPAKKMSKKFLEGKPVTYINIYRKHIKYYEMVAIKPYLERLVKCNLFNLAKEVFYSDNAYNRIDNVLSNVGTSLVQTLKLIGKAQLRECIKRDISLNELKIIQRYNKERFKPRSIERILYITRELTNRDETYILSDKKIDKIISYLKSQNYNSNPAHDYFDYLRTAEKLRYNMKSSMVLYPYNLKKAHDEAHAALKDEENQELFKRINKLLPKMHERYDFKYGTLFITAPNKAKDIVYEGQALNHCVGGYINSVADEKTTILFVRKQEEPEKPYVTVEVRNDRVCQVRGFGNSSPDESVRSFIEEFKRKKYVS